MAPELGGGGGRVSPCAGARPGGAGRRGAEGDTQAAPRGPVPAVVKTPVGSRG